MIVTVKNNQVFQAVNTEFSFYVPSGEYTLYMSADGVNYTPYEETIQGEDTIVVGGVVPSMYFYIDGLTSDIKVNI